MPQTSFFTEFVMSKQFDRVSYSRVSGSEQFHVTQRSIAALEPAERDRIFYDSKLSGFGVRVTKRGKKAFVLNYYAGKRERRLTIGRWPTWSAEAARIKANALRVEIDNGADPQGNKQAARGAPVLKELCDEYITRHAIPHKAASSLKQDRRMITTRVLPVLGKLRVSAVGMRDVESLHNSLRESPYEANRVLSLLSKMFSLAIEWKMRTNNPCKGIKRFREDKHEAWLTEQQFQRFELALNEYEVQSAANALRLLMLTGARRGEVVNATWPQFDLTRGTWTRPAHTTKERKTEVVPLSEAAMIVLRRMERQKSAESVEFLFPGQDGTKARWDLMNCWRMVCRKAGIATQYPVQGKRGMLKRWKPTVRLNDLRHSYASFLASGGVSLLVIGKLLGHSSPQTTMRYAHCHDHALRTATNSFDDLRRPKRRTA
jgi:integrase